MVLHLFNTLTRKIEVFKPIKAGEVRIYSCGPTVYNYPHIGNYRAYLVADLLKKYLKYKGLTVIHAMNITDVDDKTIKNSREEGVPLHIFTKKYEQAFFEDLEKLNIARADFYPRATENIKEMVAIVKKLLEAGLAYKSKDGSIYYAVSKSKDYGKLAHIKHDQLKAGARVSQDEYEKDEARDFALWKAWTPEDGDVYWKTEIGKGRPGWHIECSAMSMKYLGPHFDIHTGGTDLIFPHHENEIAQSEGFTGSKTVNYWVHNEWLVVEGKKMSKSLGNFYTLRDILEKGYDPKAVRYLLLSTHYRQRVDFSFPALEACQKTVEKLTDFVHRLKEVKGGHDNKEFDKLVQDTRRYFEEGMDDDLNISKALATIFYFVGEVNKLMAKHRINEKNVQSAIILMEDFDRILGILDHGKQTLDQEIETLIRRRDEARANKDWKTADEIRSQLKAKGIILEDKEGGVRWRKVKSGT
jgi:cysteinyl-tRNA synthetase